MFSEDVHFVCTIWQQPKTNKTKNCIVMGKLQAVVDNKYSSLKGDYITALFDSSETLNLVYIPVFHAGNFIV